MELEPLEKQEIWFQSLDALKEELEENLSNLNGDKTQITNSLNKWLNNRDILIQRLCDICDELKKTRRKCNRATVTTSIVSLMGGIGLAGGLFVTSAVSIPLIALGGAVSAVGSVCQVSVAAGESIKSHSLVKKCEKEIEFDAKCLDDFLKSIDQYIYRIQVFEKELKEKQEERRARGVIETAYYGIRFGKSFNDYFKALRQMEVVVDNAQKSINIYQRLSNFVKATRVYRAIFKSTAKGAATQAAGAGAKLMGKRVFALLGIACDVSSILIAKQELDKDLTPAAVLELENTIDKLILEKAEIQEIFFLTCQ